MDLQEYLNNQVAAMRAKEMIDSPQLTLGELILKLEAIEDKSKKIVLDFNNLLPTDVDSWRGSYCELAIEYDEKSDIKNAQVFLDKLKSAVGNTFQGYKGGDFRMGRQTPVWVSNYGEAESIGVVDVKDGDIVTIVTEVFVLNINGYIGESTRSEIDYAITHNKPVSYWCPLPDAEGASDD